ncbi:MAG: YihY family inner membrane protein [Phycisphaerales bacterium]|nr:YihY family inner membrane protein [Phycisphaerales bacterium]
MSTQEPTQPPSLSQRIRTGLAWLRQAVTEPQRNLDELQKRVRRSFEVGRYSLRHLAQDRAPQMAASLAFRTLFGILPVLVVATVAARSLLGDKFQTAVTQLIEQMGLNDVKIIPPSLTESTVTEPIGLGAWIDGIVATASKIDVSALGWVGICVVIFSAISLMVTIENGFNQIYRARTGRSWARRLLVYWCVLTVGPLMLGVMPWAWGQLSALLATLPNWYWLAVTIQVGSSVLMFWLFMLVIYVWVPNASVQFKPALIGALVAAILLEIGKRSLGAYMQNAFSVSSLYGSLGLIPVFMFWMYLMWMFVLFGLEVAAILQALRGRALESMREEELGGLIDPAAIIPVMAAVSSGFEDGRALGCSEVAMETGIRAEVVDLMLERLELRGFLHQVEPKGKFVLAKPPEQIQAGELMDVAFELVDDAAIARIETPILDGLREAQRTLAAKRSLKSLCDELPGA